MGFWLKRVALLAVSALLFWKGMPILAVMAILLCFTGWLCDRYANRVCPPPEKDVSPAAKVVHQEAFVADLHADVCLWDRDHLRRNRLGHVDLPRLQEGNVALQFVTVPTKLVMTKRMPQLFLADLFFGGSIFALEPPRIWFSVTQRARMQLARAERWIAGSDGALKLIRSRADLDHLRQQRAEGGAVVGIMLGLEGAHAVKGSIDVPWLAEKGFRVLGITHFNDTVYADSAHGWRKRGLTPAGRKLAKQLEAHAITIDLAHLSTAAIDEILTMHDKGELQRSFIASHTGVKGMHDCRRNITDEQAVRIARSGGLIGVTFFKPAIPRTELSAVIETVRYVVDLLDRAGVEGARHVAFGSDFDGAVKTVIDAAGWPYITAALLEANFSEEETQLILGENVARFFTENLPAA